MSTAEKNTQHLFNSIHLKEVRTIECTKCEEYSVFSGEKFYFEAADVAYEEGWRATEKNVYCPKCAKKFRIK
jgi:Zn finger protein HypA/HybF involved in hydrogenase expression